MLRRLGLVDDWMVRETEIGLAGSIGAMGRFSEAETLMLTAWNSIAALPYVNIPYKQRWLKTIVRFYESWDAAEPGKGYAEKAAEWRAMREEQGTKARRHEGTKEE
jgi:hypothetical protein